MMQPPSDGLSALLGSIRQSLAAKRANRAQRRGELFARTRLHRDTSLEEVLKRIQAELEWEPQACVLMTQMQHCECGRTHHCVVGMFIRKVHKVNGATRFVPHNGASAADRLCRERRTIEVQVPVCPECWIERDLADLIVNGVPAKANGQFALFPSLG
jgi:hypothetical protein